MLVSVHRTELLVGALLIAMYSMFVALEAAARSRGADRAVSRGWWMGGSLAVGTGLWAATVMGMLSAQPPEAVAQHPALALAAWLFSISAVAVALGTSSLARPTRSQLAGAGALSGVLLCLTYAIEANAMATGSPVIWEPWQSGAAVALALLTSTVLVAALVRHAGIASRETAAWRLAGVVTVLSAAMLGNLYFASGAGSTPTGSADQHRLPSDALALLAGSGALVALTMTRMTATIERWLTRKSERLATSLCLANRNLRKIAYHDPLTRLANRPLFEHRLGRAFERAARDNTRLALMFIDLDGFKAVNDSFGHCSGDGVLCAVGDRLRTLVSKGDTVARIGGDEFVMLSENTADSGAAALRAARLLGLLGQPFSVGDRYVTLTCSIGIAFYPDGADKNKLVARADAAMYAAKRAGGSTYCFFEPGMASDSSDQLALMDDLRQAIGRGELELYYQPKVDARSGQITAAEALLRWQHPQRGLISPGEFLPLAERFGLIASLGNWVIEEVCRQSREWCDEGLRMRVSINVSAHQIKRHDLVNRIERTLHHYRLDPQLLTCEITESAALNDTEATQRVFQRLAKAGVRLSIDDFGTGYSSLSYLRQLPAVELKIDRSFLLDLQANADACAIVEAVIQLAHALGLRVVAEGVETQEQCDILTSLGCDELQGYLFARPMPAKALLQRTQASRSERQAFRPSLFLKSWLATLH